MRVSGIRNGILINFGGSEAEYIHATMDTNISWT